MKYKIGLLGCGTVGTGVYEILNESEYLKDKAQIKKILVRDKNKPRALIDMKLLTTNVDEILNDNEINLIVEVMGGGDLAYEAMKKALNHHKHVITANKEVLSKHLIELVELAHQNDVYFLYEAAVGGGVPIIQNVINNSKTNEINSLKGIINGSTNYLLSLIQQSGSTYDMAFEKASKLGYLEADPTDDIYGYDSARKMSILATMCFRGEVNVDHAYTYPISNANDQFIIYINNKGYVLKYIAEAIKKDNQVSIRVEPTIVKKESVFGMVNDALNIVEIEGTYTGKLDFIGAGAGKFPTASSVITDLVLIIENKAIVDFVIKENLITCKNELFYNSYLIQTNEELSSNLIERIDGPYIYTKKISALQLSRILKKASFYARIED